MGFLPYPASTRVRIRRVPPTGKLEGIDLAAFCFENGRIYDLKRDIANVLLAWKYAELVNGLPLDSLDQSSQTATCPKCGPERPPSENQRRPGSFTSTAISAGTSHRGR
jgi:hypothetical protein